MSLVRAIEIDRVRVEPCPPVEGGLIRLTIGGKDAVLDRREVEQLVEALEELQ